MFAKPPGRGRRGGPVRALLLIVFLCPVVTGASQAPAGPAAPDPGEEWDPTVVASLRSFFERIDVEEVMEGLSSPVAGPESLRPEAWGSTLPADMRGPWAAIRHGFELVPYVGSVRGAGGTLAARGGNSLDRALLLARLYAAAGRRVRLVRGQLDWEQASGLLGVADGEAGADPWLRWMEMLADHWWLEVRDGGDWIPVDPTAAGRPGEAPGRATATMETVPSELVAMAEVALLAGDEQLFAARLPVADLLDRPVRVAAVRQPPRRGPEATAPERQERGSGEFVDSPDRREPGDRPVAEPSTGQRDPREDPGSADEEDPVRARLPRIETGPVVLEVRIGDRREETRPVGRPELSGVRLRVRVRLPRAQSLETEIPFGARPDARIALVLGAGPVAPARLARAAAPLWRALGELARVEAEAATAFRERPRPERREEPVAVPQGPAPPAEVESEEGAAEADDEELHPAERLQLQVLNTWLEFDRQAPTALALALLSGVDRLAGPAWLTRPGVRLAGVHWRPPAVGSEGRFVVWLDDRVVMKASPERIPRMQAAHGLLQSAISGQVLNGMADGAPVTAFDVTLRSVGTGRRLSWWGPGESAPEEWPEEARRRVEAALGSGYLVAGPTAPTVAAGRSLLGWWRLPPRLGVVEGWAATPEGLAQAWVRFGDPRSTTSLDAVLGSAPELHDALRWMIRAADPESGLLVGLRSGVCAATSLVGDMMDAGAPPGWPGADFTPFCAGQPRP